MAGEERSSGFPAESSASSESDGHNDGIDLEAREKNLALSTIDEQDVDLSIAFINIHDRVADKT